MKKFLAFLLLLFCVQNAKARVSVPIWTTAQGFPVCALRDKSGDLWFGTEGAGLWHFDPWAPPDRAWRNFSVSEGLPDAHVLAIAQDRRGRIWAGTASGGVAVWNGAWRSYDATHGPFGERVQAIAVSPLNGDIWLGTNAGLARYDDAKSAWSNLSRASGDAATALPSDQIVSVAFNSAGTLFAATACDGLAIANAKDNYRAWKTVRGLDAPPNTASGAGLPSNLINAVLVTSDDTIWVATSCGLASSRDNGASWSFVRGRDWRLKALGRTQPPTLAPAKTNESALLLNEDWVSSLSEDEGGALWLGFRRRGLGILDANTGRVSFADENARDDWVRAVAFAPDLPPLVVHYGGDKNGVAAFGQAPQNADTPRPQTGENQQHAPFPAFATAPDAALLKRLQARFQDLSAPSTGSALFLGEDWTSKGDWVGRYGSGRATLCAMGSPLDHDLTTNLDYSLDNSVGPHYVGYKGTFRYIQRLVSENPNALYDPTDGARREAEWNDGSWQAEQYPETWQGPDIWVSLRVPQGTHRVSFYFFNKDGHDGPNRFRDYLLQIKLKTPGTDLGSMDDERAPTLAHSRVHDFWNGVYHSYALTGPAEFALKVGREGSHVTIISGVFFDAMSPPNAPAPARALPFMGSVLFAPPTDAPAVADDAATAGASLAARELWNALPPAPKDGASASLLRSARLLAYRAAQNAQSPDAQLARWRWTLGLWTPSDREIFKATMARAWEIEHARREAGRAKPVDAPPVEP